MTKLSGSRTLLLGCLLGATITASAVQPHKVTLSFRHADGAAISSGVVLWSSSNGAAKDPIIDGKVVVLAESDALSLVVYTDAGSYQVNAIIPAGRDAAELVLGARLPDSPPADGGIAGPAYAELCDAPQAIPGQPTGAAGNPLTSIAGNIASTTDVDMYLINIPAGAETTWEISTVGTAGTLADTQLFLFTADGTAVVANDDTPVGGGLRSMINGLTCPTSPGDHYVAITGYNIDPQNSDPALIWLNTPFNVIRCPDGPGAANPVLASWTGTCTAGTYTLMLTNINSAGGAASATGACCFSDGTCQVLSPSECSMAGGAYNGDCSSCATATCSGGCCLPSGDCTVTGPIGCAQQMGTYRGDGTTCAGALCTGRCCLSGGGCQVLSPSGCASANGTYGGNGTNCATMGNVTTYESSNVPVSIPDVSSASSTLNVADSYSIVDLDVCLIITHTWQGDLSVDLTSPASTLVTIVNRPGNPQATFGFSTDNYGNPTTGEFFTLDDEATQGPYDTPVTAVNNVSGRWLPDLGPLSAFDGENVNGTWTLTVRDQAGGDVGSITRWQIKAAAQGGPPCGMGCIVGDSNNDGQVDNFDIDFFVAALVNAGCNADPTCRCLNDIDRSGQADNFDIDPFVACLSNLPMPGDPCP